ncbi:hypothetical protein BGLA2_1000080 [Burkholderia gladioli]|nr:hypothetical protein BGLA2_1000080 [Burkholderia gladioli]
MRASATSAIGRWLVVPFAFRSKRALASSSVFSRVSVWCVDMVPLLVQDAGLDSRSSSALENKQTPSRVMGTSRAGASRDKQIPYRERGREAGAGEQERRGGEWLRDGRQSEGNRSIIAAISHERASVRMHYSLVDIRPCASRIGLRAER